jgi:hypothetical protein
MNCSCPIHNPLSVAPINFAPNLLASGRLAVTALGSLVTLGVA